ncbi:MAG: hypothetical protein WBP93_19805 [Pyrinomonadaceae bacterium]
MDEQLKHKNTESKNAGSDSEQNPTAQTEATGKTQSGADEDARPEDEVTGEGTGARAGEYS